MLPDSIPSPKTAEPLEAQLHQWELADAPASLDERMEALFASPPTVLTIPERPFWQKEGPWMAAFSGIAACAALVVLILPTLQPKPTNPPQSVALLHAPVETPATALPAESPRSAPQVFEAAVPVGYQYQSSRALYAQETPVGTVKDEAGLPQQAYQRRTLLRHTFEDPKTHATYEVDAPKEELILENLQSY